MIGWYVTLAFAALALVFFLLYLYEHGDHKETSQAWRQAEVDWSNDRIEALRLIGLRTAERNALQLQLDEALKTKPIAARKPRASTKKERIEP